MKKLHLITVGARPPAWAQTAAESHIRQLARFELIETRIRHSAPDKEAAEVLAHIPAAGRGRGHLALLAPGGRVLDSAGFAEALAGWLQKRHATLVIAGATGAAPALVSRADEQVSLSPLTFSHTLARLALIEQLYRADCVFRNHPYPK